ncbi:MAG: magnesium transporter CorA family protein [Rhabdochlamydiaceae bacterium]|nr:magnesium transporter CorA family protein [Rhabdochlamydiaceae bacterium]
MLFFYHKASPEEPFCSISKPVPGCWIHAEEADHEDLLEIGSLLGLNPTLLYDALDRYELPRLEIFEKHLILFIRHPVEQERSLYTATLTVLISSDYFITISPIKTSSLIEPVIYKQDLVPSTDTSDWMRALLLWVAQEFNLFIRRTRHNILSQEKEFGAVTSEDIYALTQYEETLNQYLASLDALSLTLEKFFQMPTTSFYTQNKEMVEDILNHVKQAESLCEIIIKNIRSLRDAYQIIFANNLTKTIKLLTALTIVFTIPNIVASIFGMNVHLPLAEHSHSFSILLAIMFLLSGLCGYWFYRKNWM